jgi:hypothetical protein
MLELLSRTTCLLVGNLKHSSGFTFHAAVTKERQLVLHGACVMLEANGQGLLCQYSSVVSGSVHPWGEVFSVEGKPLSAHG